MQKPGEHQADAGDDGLLAGRYRVIEQLGHGGMGLVRRARDEVLGREVAVKELRVSRVAGEPAGLRQRMEREARAAARVRHPGVVAVHDITEHDGRPVIVMELVDGPSLEDVLREGETLEPARVAAIGAEVLDALAAAHRSGVLHRDVKPGNILLERGGRVVLTDFGIAAVEEADDGSTARLTGSGELVGSLDYLAPERARGEELGPSSDLWALGATLYAAVEGASPFRRTSAWSTLTAIVAEPLPEPRNAGVLAPVLAELMHKDTRQRADAARAAELLRAAMAPGHGSEESRRSSPAGPSPTARTRDADTLRLTRQEFRGTATPRRGPPPSPPPSDGTPAPTPSDIGGHPDEAVTGSAPGSDWDGRSPLPSPGRDDGGDSRRQTVPRPDVAPRRRRVAIAASVAAVVLASAGVTWAVVEAGGSGGETTATVDRSASQGARSSGGRPEVGGSTGETTTEPPESGRPSSGSPGPGSTAPAGTAGSAHGGGRDGGSRHDADSGGASSGGGAEGGGTSGGGSPGGGGGSATGGGSGATGGAGGPEPSPPQPSCQPIGGGKYDCQVWRTATSYNEAHQPVGQLRAGTNYFFCQKKLPYRETSGQWTNVWWARTDDDSGNAGVYVSVVYIEGGANNKPIPGLPTC